MRWVINATHGKNTDTHCGGGLVGSGRYERAWGKKIFWLLPGPEPQTVQTIQCCCADYEILAHFQ